MPSCLRGPRVRPVDLGCLACPSFVLTSIILHCGTVRIGASICFSSRVCDRSDSVGCWLVAVPRGCPGVLVLINMFTQYCLRVAGCVAQCGHNRLSCVMHGFSSPLPTASGSFESSRSPLSHQCDIFLLYAGGRRHWRGSLEGSLPDMRFTLGNGTTLR